MSEGQVNGWKDHLFTEYLSYRVTSAPFGSLKPDIKWRFHQQAANSPPEVWLCFLCNTCHFEVYDREWSPKDKNISRINEILFELICSHRYFVIPTPFVQTVTDFKTCNDRQAIAESDSINKIQLFDYSIWLFDRLNHISHYVVRQSDIKCYRSLSTNEGFRDRLVGSR